MSFAVTAVATAGATSAYLTSRSANAQANNAIENAERRYAFKSGISSQQMEEQQQIAMSQMTEVTRKFLEARGTIKAQQAEGITGGKSKDRELAISRMKESEVKGKVARDIDTNIINIAQGALANKIDTEAMISEANSKKQNVFTNTVLGAMQGYIQGRALTSGGDASQKTSLTDGGSSASQDNFWWK